MNITQPIAITSPITDADLKLYLRVDGTVEDSTITAVNLAAAERVQEEIGRCLTPATLIGNLDQFPVDRWIDLPYGPVTEIVAVEYYDTNGSLQDFTDSCELVNDRLYLLPSASWPTVQSNRAAAVEITYVAGYSIDSSGPTCPQPIQQAVKWIAGTMFENRESVVTGTIATELPQNAKWALSPYKVRF